MIHTPEQIAYKISTLAKQAEATGNIAEAIKAYKALIQHFPNMEMPYNKYLQLRQFHANAPLEHNASVFEKEALPLLLHCLQNGHIAPALDIETIIYGSYIKQVESEDHYHENFAKWTPAMEAAGQQILAQLPPLTPPEYTHNGAVKLGFFFHTSVILAHTEVILGWLRGMRDLEHQRITPIIYVLMSPGNKPLPAFNAAFAGLAEVHYLYDYTQTGKHSVLHRLVALRQLVHTHGTHALLWVSAPSLLGFASAMRVAPVQIWWAMRFHPDVFSHIDGYMGGGSLFSKFRELKGRQWRSVFVAYNNLTLDCEQEATFIRAKYAGKTILGIVARTEKLMEAEHLDVIARILHTHPECVYLWTGREDAPLMRAELKARGIENQCDFIGWIEPRLYARVFDIFLDSFPSGGGLTSIQAMAAGTPVVGMNNYLSMLANFALPSYERREGTQQQQDDIQALFTGDDGCSLMSCANTADTYIAWASTLINNTTMRKAVGAAQQKFTHRYLCNAARMAEHLNNHVIEIVEQTLQSPLPEGQK